MEQDKPNKNARPKPGGGKGTPSSPTSASVWKKKTVGGTLFTVPSGNIVLMRTPGMQAFLTSGVIPNTLLPIIQDAMTKDKPPSQRQLEEMATDPKAIQEVMELADAIVVMVCLDPQVSGIPKDGQDKVIPIGDERRDEDILYVDEIDFEDKMFIFNVAVGGTSDLEKFRQQLGSDVAALPERADVEQASI